MFLLKTEPKQTSDMICIGSQDWLDEYCRPMKSLLWLDEENNDVYRTQNDETESRNYISAENYVKVMQSFKINRLSMSKLQKQAYNFLLNRGL